MAANQEEQLLFVLFTKPPLSERLFLFVYEAVDRLVIELR
jgi:hypothetical protein